MGRDKTREEPFRAATPYRGQLPLKEPCGEKLLSSRFQASTSECKFMAGVGDNLDQDHPKEFFVYYCQFLFLGE